MCFELSKRTDLLHNLSLMRKTGSRSRCSSARARLSRAHPAYRSRARRSHKAHRTARGPSTCTSCRSSSGCADRCGVAITLYVGSEGAAAPRHPGRGLMIAGFGTGGVLRLAAGGGLGIAGQLAKNSLESHPITLMQLEAVYVSCCLPSRDDCAGGGGVCVCCRLSGGGCEATVGRQLRNGYS